MVNCICYSHSSFYYVTKKIAIRTKNFEIAVCIAFFTKKTECNFFLLLANKLCLSHIRKTDNSINQFEHFHIFHFIFCWRKISNRINTAKSIWERENEKKIVKRIYNHHQKSFIEFTRQILLSHNAYIHFSLLLCEPSQIEIETRKWKARVIKKEIEKKQKLKVNIIVWGNDFSYSDWIKHIHIFVCWMFK